MKKSTLIVVVIIALLVSMLPMSTAFASKGVQYSTVTINNRTKGVVVLTAIDAKGFRYFYTFDAGYVYKITVPQGNYEFFVTSPCKDYTNQYNLTRNKTLNFYCAKGGSFKSLSYITSLVK